MDNHGKSFWTTLPALLTAAGTLIAAITGAVALYINLNSNDSDPPEQPAVEARKPELPDLPELEGKKGPPPLPPPGFGPGSKSE